jgi:hypothetical protein
MHTVFLTREEKKEFLSLPTQYQDGWQVEEETIPFADSEESWRLRRDLLTFSDQGLKGIEEKVRSAASQEEVERAVENLQLSGLSDADLAELFFALGPVALSAIILRLLPLARSDDDVASLAAFTVIRHNLLLSQ